MKKRYFVGKHIVPAKLNDYKLDINPPGSYDDEFITAEIFLYNFDCDMTDRTGRNAYSLRLYLDNDYKIVDIVRVGHCHMCNGQGSDDDLRTFPHKTLEEEAEDFLSCLLDG